MLPTRKKTEAGFTLIELLVVMGIGVMIIGAALWLQRDVIKFNSILHGAFSMQAQSRRAFKQISKEIRVTNFAENGAYPIEQADGNAMTFYSDHDSDGTVERIRYFVSGDNLRKGIIEPSGVPATYNPDDEQVDTIMDEIVTGGSDMFEYYDSSYDGTSDPLSEPFELHDVRLVKITVTVDSNGDRLPEPRTYTTQVSMRNLKDNL